MTFESIYTPERLHEKAQKLFAAERAIKRLDGWFILKEAMSAYEQAHANEPNIVRKANALYEACKILPLSIDENAVFAGTQRDAFAKSYALINPNFRVNTFNGYCDPTAVFGDIEPDGKFTEERIRKVKDLQAETEYVKALSAVYKDAETDTEEVAYFIEQVTGHLIPDFKPALKNGLNAMLCAAEEKKASVSGKKAEFYAALVTSLKCALLLAERYAAIAEEQRKTAGKQRAAELSLLIQTLKKVPANGAENLYEAIQSFLLLWQVMCLEQAPNPFAFSVGNADRIFEPYRAAEGTERALAAGLFKHMLVFYNVGDRSWAISQNLIVGGKSNGGEDLTNESSYALLDAYYEMNMPQPILSVKLHKNTPAKLYEEMGRFFFTAGCLTPSLFNDDAVFEVLRSSGVEECDLENYSVAGCQEPLIMGKDNGNTTNSWLNMAKILELTLTGGKSLITGKQIGRTYEQMGVKGGVKEVLSRLKELFYENLQYYIDRMAKAANGASKAVSELPVPFLSAFMGGMESGIDVRDAAEQGTKYNGSGCLIHGLAVVADSFIAAERFLRERPDECDRLLSALQNDFKGEEELREYLLSLPKYGNNLPAPDAEAAEIAAKVSDMVRGAKNYLGNPFRADWSSPTTHLLYGYWVGATPDGRHAREMLGYGVDPLFGEATNGLGFRLLSCMKLPFEKFNGGYASHLGLNPAYFKADTFAAKGLEFRDKIFAPLFFSSEGKVAPFYVYFNITTPETLRKVLANPKKYAPNGVYIMRIHGTFVNFLDLSPEIQQDIIKRLDPASTCA
ncbi:MAG: hypothetical protein DBX59_00685 [Bacillota bacterium]|nr:MAG: hypothetical protein DBX59_00685 [Bacillota bacterium]